MNVLSKSIGYDIVHLLGTGIARHTTPSRRSHMVSITPPKKDECVNHITRLHFTRFSRKIRGSGLAMIGGKGRCIRENKGKPEAMSKEVWAILDHYLSPSRHKYCPSGPKSWCLFNCDPLRPANRELMIPLFTRLGSVPFLQACSNC